LGASRIVNVSVVLFVDSSLQYTVLGQPYELGQRDFVRKFCGQPQSNLKRMTFINPTAQTGRPRYAIRDLAKTKQETVKL